jgi:hypothetical protein
MKLTGIINRPATLIRNLVSGSKGWPLVASFLAGAVLLFTAAPALAPDGVKQDSNVPQDIPAQNTPGFLPGTDSFDIELAYAPVDVGLI